MWRNTGIPTVLALCALLSVGAPAAAQQAAPAPAVIVAPAEISDIRPRASFSGRLTAAQQIALRARVSGFLEEIGFVEGARVSEGDVLYRIEDDPYVAAADQIRGSIAAAQAELRLAEIERDRKQTLVEREAVAQSELDIAIANVGRAEGQIARLEADLARALLDVRYTEIVAPFDGVVGLSTYDIGALVGPDSEPLAMLTRTDPMSVEFPVATALLLDYRAEAAGGSEPGVRIRLPNGVTYDRTGQIDFVNAEVAPGTDTVLLRAVFDNPDNLLIDGGLVEVELEQSAPNLVLNVPRRAVQRDQIGDFVLVVDSDSAVELRRVEVAGAVDGRSVIRSGLEAGELVITDGVNKVRPGVTVDAAVAAAD
jgi:membrane fusion protein (multidrug efflux system)